MLWLVPHLFPPARLLEAATQDLRLPALQTLLARGSRRLCPNEGVEAALCEALGIARQQDWPLAPITLEADGGKAGDAYWLRADPVHLHLTRDRIVLTDCDDLGITQEEADALAAAIGGHFGDALRPAPLHPQRWYLSFIDPLRLTTTPRSLATGRAIDRLLPQGEDAAQVRAQLNELQMLLFADPINQAREARGDLAVNSVWLWGGGSRPVAPSSQIRVYARDHEARALGAFCNAAVRPLPERLDWDIMKSNGVILLDQLTRAGQNGDAYGWRESIRALEQDWFAPLLDRLNTIDPQGLRVLDPVNGKALHLRRSDAWKIWRHARSLDSMLA